MISDGCSEHLSRAELYLQACQHTGAIPVSSFLCNLNQAHFTLNHYGVGPLGAKALAIALKVGETFRLHALCLNIHFHGNSETPLFNAGMGLCKDRFLQSYDKISGLGSVNKWAVVLVYKS